MACKVMAGCGRREEAGPIKTLSEGGYSMASTMIAPAAVADQPGKDHAGSHTRLAVLDGWRAFSILLVLGCHMLPLGPRRFELNAAAGVAGMSMFFTLSGFLIVTTLHRHPSVATFLIRRLFRIVPLSALASVVFLLILQKGPSYFPPHLLYYLNYDHPHMTELTGHFWSLCVEVQFYLFAAFLLAVAGLRGLIVLPLVGLIVTGLKIREGAPHAIVTHLRVDEIMVGASLGLIWNDRLGAFGRTLAQGIIKIPTAVALGLFLASNLRFSGPLQYAQPYLAGALIGRTLMTATFLNSLLCTRPLRYIAEISYALYVIHPATMHGWLGAGDTYVKYAKRPLSFLLSFALSHLSTFKYEHHFMAFGKQLCRRIEHRERAIVALEKQAG
jgi:peptidoglycan/LPS O-acetylase OafA/YrhL